MNSITLVGRLTRDPELKTSKAGSMFCNFTICVYNPYKGVDGKDDFFDCVAFGKTAERISSYGEKGKMVGVSGAIHQKKYTKNDGTVVTTFEVSVNECSIIDRPTDSAPRGRTAQAPDFDTDDYDPFADN